MTDAVDSVIAKAKAELEAELKKVADEFRQESHAATGIVPQVVTAASSAVEDTPSTEDLLNTIKNLYQEIEGLKKQGAGIFGQLAGNAAVDFAQGGDPVPHTLHLDNGSVVQSDGLATHIANADGTVSRVVAAYPVAPNTAKA
jgi:hypothetical protein